MFRQPVLRQSVHRRVPRRSTLSLLILLVIAAGIALAQTAAQPPVKIEKAGAAGNIARGKYIVEGVAVCGQCHTPRDSNGNFDRSRWLQGAPVPYMPAKPNSDWPINAPRIGGTPPASDADMIKLLMTGIWSDGNRLRLPMPGFRMDRSDAEAVVAYLRSVTPNQ